MAIRNRRRGGNNVGIAGTKADETTGRADALGDTREASIHAIDAQGDDVNVVPERA